jgi:hypothetical protein
MLKQNILGKKARGILVTGIRDVVTAKAFAWHDTGQRKKLGGTYTTTTRATLAIFELVGYDFIDILLSRAIISKPAPPAKAYQAYIEAMPFSGGSGVGFASPYLRPMSSSPPKENSPAWTCVREHWGHSVPAGTGRT